MNYEETSKSLKTLISQGLLFPLPQSTALSEPPGSEWVQRDGDQGCEHRVPHVAGSSAVPGQGLGAGAAEGMPEIILNVAGDVFQTPHGFSEVMELKQRNLPLQKLLQGGSQKRSQGISPGGHVSEAGLSPRPVLQQPRGTAGAGHPASTSGQHLGWGTPGAGCSGLCRLGALTNTECEMD